MFIGDLSDCSCNPGFFGKHCSECQCENGNCDLNGSCLCHSGYSGEFCEICAYEEYCFGGDICVCKTSLEKIFITKDIIIESQTVTITTMNVIFQGEGEFSDSDIEISDTQIRYESNLTLSQSFFSITSDSLLTIEGCLKLKETDISIRIRDNPKSFENAITLAEYSCLEGEFDSVRVETDEGEICNEKLEYGTNSLQVIFSVANVRITV